MKCAAVTLCLLSFALLAGPVRSAEALRRELGQLAQKIKKLLEEQKQDAIAVGEFRGPPGLETASGPGIQQGLIEQLRALKVNVRPRADLSLRGEYLLVPDPRKDRDDERDRVAVRLRAVVSDLRGEKLLSLEGSVRDLIEIAQLMGATATLQKRLRADLGDRSELLGKQIKKPSVFIDGTKVQTVKDSPYAVEVLVKDSLKGRAEPRRARVEEGQAFVPIKKGEFYEVRVRNNSRYDAAVTVTIDGLDVFSFSKVIDPKTRRPRFTHFIVRPGTAMLIKGWHYTNKEALLFQAVPLAESALAKKVPEVALLRSAERLGAITVCFRAAWIEGEVPPEESGARRDSGGTGVPGRRPGRLREPRRTLGMLREVVTVRRVR
jgi:hypothetical protein